MPTLSILNFMCSKTLHSWIMHLNKFKHKTHCHAWNKTGTSHLSSGGDILAKKITCTSVKQFCASRVAKEMALSHNVECGINLGWTEPQNPCQFELKLHGWAKLGKQSNENQTKHCSEKPNCIVLVFDAPLMKQ